MHDDLYVLLGDLCVLLCECNGFLQQAFCYGGVEFYNVEACECVPVFFLYVSEP